MSFTDKRHKDSSVNQNFMKIIRKVAKGMDKSKMKNIVMEKKRICQANIVGIVLLIAAFVIPIFAVCSINWIAESAFKLL